MEWIYQAPILFFSIIFHEFAHGYMAFRRGDDTAYHSGRLTLNPISHIDLVGTIIIPVLCQLSGLPMFGWAKPVPINPLRLISPRMDLVKIAACGPLANIILCVAFAVLTKLTFLSQDYIGAQLTVTAIRAFNFGVTVNLVLAIFNLIPLSPLDGSRIMAGLLPYEWAVKYETHSRYAPFILMALVITGAIKYVILPPLALSIYLLIKLGLVM